MSTMSELDQLIHDLHHAGFPTLAEVVEDRVNNGPPFDKALLSELWEVAKRSDGYLRLLDELRRWPPVVPR